MFKKTLLLAVALLGTESAISADKISDTKKIECTLCKTEEQKQRLWETAKDLDKQMFTYTMAIMSPDSAENYEPTYNNLHISEEARAYRRLTLFSKMYLCELISFICLDWTDTLSSEDCAGTQYSTAETDKQKQALKAKIQSAMQPVLNSPHMLAFLKYAQQDANLDRFDATTSENDSSTPENISDQLQTPILNAASNAFTKASTSFNIWPR
jgi:hypothetical protein